MGRFSTGVSKTAGDLRGKFSLGALAGAAAIYEFGKKSIAAYEESTTTLAELERTTAKMPQLSSDFTQAIEDQSQSLQDHTGFLKDDIEQAAIQLARFKLNKEQIQSALPVILDYARATGKAVPDAAQAVGKALLGNTRALKTVGIDFTATGNRAADFAKILHDLQNKVSGAADAFAKTDAGKIELFKAKVHDLEIVVGKELVTALSSLYSAVRPILPALELAAKNAGLLLTAFVGYKTLSFLPALLRGVGLALGALKFDTAANGAYRASFALKEMGLGVSFLATSTTLAAVALAAFDVAIASRVAGALPHYQKAVDEASGSTKKFAQLSNQAASAGRFAGAKLAATSQAYLDNKAAADAAATAYKQFQRGAAGVAHATEQASGALEGEQTAASQAAWAAARLAAENKKAADQARNLRLAELSLAGGALGVAAAQQQVAKDQADLTRLRAAGKTKTKEYAAAVQQAIGDELSLADAVDKEKQQSAQSGAAHQRLAGVFAVLRKALGLTKGDMAALFGTIAAGNASVDRLNSGLDHLKNEGTITVHVHTEYTESGPRPPGKVLP